MTLFSQISPDELLSDPRDHHYVFAHHAVRQICLDDPLHFFALIASEQQQDFVHYIWDAVNSHFAEQTIAFDINETEIYTGKIKNYPTIFIKMPTPKAIAEAYMVGIVLKLTAEQPATPQTVPIDYYTLELGQDLDGTLRTVFCKWENDQHVNMGDGHSTDVDEFASEIEMMI